MWYFFYSVALNGFSFHEFALLHFAPVYLLLANNQNFLIYVHSRWNLLYNSEMSLPEHKCWLFFLTELYPTRKIHGADPGRLVNSDTASELFSSTGEAVLCKHNYWTIFECINKPYIFVCNWMLAKHRNKQEAGTP